MRINLIVVGKTSIDHVQEGIDMYNKRLHSLADFQYRELTLKKQNQNPKVLKQQEGIEILKATEGSTLILLDERGKTFSSIAFSKYIEQFGISGHKTVSFVIGGAFGFSDEVHRKCSGKVALSSMTFSHQLVRLIAMEQLYRAHAIIKGLPYHHA